MQAMGNWAEKRNIPYSGYTDLAARDEVYELVRECVERVNADLAQEPEIANSQIHRFLILHKELDADDEELTRTRKVRRGFIAEKYAPLVTALYDGSRTVHVEAQVRYEDGRTGTYSADLKIRDAKTFPPAAANARLSAGSCHKSVISRSACISVTCWRISCRVLPVQTTSVVTAIPLLRSRPASSASHSR